MNQIVFFYTLIIFTYELALVYSGFSPLFRRMTGAGSS